MFCINGHACVTTDQTSQLHSHILLIAGDIKSKNLRYYLIAAWVPCDIQTGVGPTHMSICKKYTILCIMAKCPFLGTEVCMFATTMRAPWRLHQMMEMWCVVQLLGHVSIQVLRIKHILYNISKKEMNKTQSQYVQYAEHWIHSSCTRSLNHTCIVYST